MSLIPIECQRPNVHSAPAPEAPRLHAATMHAGALVRTVAGAAVTASLVAAARCTGDDRCASCAGKEARGSARAQQLPQLLGRRVVVVGAGAPGIMTAHYLSRAGYTVTVVDGREGPALETSFANAGSISVADSVPLASPATIRTALGALAGSLTATPKRLWGNARDAVTGLFGDDEDGVSRGSLRGELRELGGATPSGVGGGNDPETQRVVAAARNQVVAVRARAILGDATFWSWSIPFLRSCLDGGYVRRTEVLQDLSVLGQRCLFGAAAHAGVTEDQFDLRRTGRLVYYRDADEFATSAEAVRADAAQAAVAVADGEGAIDDAPRAPKVWSVEQATEHEPFLKVLAPRLAGAIFHPSDALGDCHKYTVAMADKLAGSVTFKYNTHVGSIETAAVEAADREAGATGDRRVIGVRTTDGALIEADAVVSVMGPGVARFMRGLGMRVPVFPVKGYSVTLPADPALASADGAATSPDQASGPASSSAATHASRFVPRGIVVDHEHRVYLTRFGDRVRVVSGAELSGYSTEHINPTVAGAVYTLARAACPSYFAAAGARLPASAAELARPTPLWMGMRPVSADGVPIVSRAPSIDGLYVNAGHGAHGWKLSAVTGAVVARLLLEDDDRRRAGASGKAAAQTRPRLAAAMADADAADQVLALDTAALSLERFHFLPWLRSLWSKNK